MKKCELECGDREEMVRRRIMVIRGSYYGTLFVVMLELCVTLVYKLV